MDQVIPTLFSLSNELLEFLLHYFLHLSLIHLNLFLNMLKDMGPILYSSRWIASCASTIYQITLNRKAIFLFYAKVPYILGSISEMLVYFTDQLVFIYASVL